MNRYYIVFLLLFGILISFLTPNVNTGDAGELITASYFLGIAHPSGYPIYLMLSKALIFLPFGNFAYKIALGSALFSSLSLTILYWMVLKLTGKNIVAVFSVLFLLSSRSFLSQSVIVKFYPLNLFFIISIVALWITLILSQKSNSTKEEKVRHANSHAILLLTAFIFGLILAHHHLGVLISAPVLVAWQFLCPKELRLLALLRDFHGRRLFLLMVLIFGAGFSVNMYLFIRGGDQFYNVFNVRNLGEFVNHITRQPYGEIGTASLAMNSFSNGFISVFSGFKNFSSIITKNFTWFAWLLFLPGSIYLWRKSRAIFLFIFVALILYGPFLAQLAFPSSSISKWEYYVNAHQYFLPGLTLFSFVAACGLFQLLNLCERLATKMVAWVLIVAGFLVPVQAMALRFVDSNFRKNHVAYQLAKDTFTILPLNSLYLAYGDNEKFQGRYLKLLGRYRDDVCQMNTVWLQETAIGIDGCTEYSYGSLTPDLLATEQEKISPFSGSGRLFSSIAFSEDFPVQKIYSAEKFSFLYELSLLGVNPGTSYSELLYGERLEQAHNLINNQACEDFATDDLFTEYLCGKYRIHVDEMIKFYISKLKSN